MLSSLFFNTLVIAFFSRRPEPVSLFSGLREIKRFPLPLPQGVVRKAPAFFPDQFLWKDIRPFL